MFRVLTKALIRKGEEILLLKRKDGSFGSGLWDIPGGKLEFGELPIESLEREIFEETSLKVKVIRPISISSGINETKTKQYITIVFLCDYQGGDIKLNDEHSEYKWVSISKIDDLEKIYYVDEAINKFLTD
ncbi:NUDIX hydrolase [Caloranaerobacter azorensis]|uniref:NUDIX hydrolase n=1 Tax=Caloranaerobacter azorensis TaxID=116090 RepID=UPI0006908804|nr:NUDIX domain-containing protein [Caloranaerobacter azorensis]